MLKRFLERANERLIEKYGYVQYVFKDSPILLCVTDIHGEKFIRRIYGRIGWWNDSGPSLTKASTISENLINKRDPLYISDQDLDIERSAIHTYVEKKLPEEDLVTDLERVVGLQKYLYWWSAGLAGLVWLSLSVYLFNKIDFWGDAIVVSMLTGILAFVCSGVLWGGLVLIFHDLIEDIEKNSKVKIAKIKRVDL